MVNLTMFNFGPYLFLSTLSVALSLLFIGLSKKSKLPSHYQNHWIHEASIPRRGGIVFFISLSLSIFLFDLHFVTLISLLLFTSFPIFIAGVLDDFGRRVSPEAKILASVTSSALAIVAFDTWVRAVDVPGLDFLLSFYAFGLIFTISASTALIQSYNLVDGLNGLSSGCGLIAFAAIAILSFQQGDVEILSICLIAFSCLSGFWLINFSTGRLF